jgi:hypothetical protein
VRHVVRLLVVFLLLFAGVFSAFHWSAAAVRFGGLRVSGQASPTWQVTGVVTDKQTRQPISWARVEDDPDGRPPFYSTEADQAGRYRLLTLAEPHRIRISAPNYVTTLVEVGPSLVCVDSSREENRDLTCSPFQSVPLDEGVLS